MRVGALQLAESESVGRSLQSFSQLTEVCGFSLAQARPGPRLNEELCDTRGRIEAWVGRRQGVQANKLESRIKLIK